jgi:hypothetical protein
VGGAGANRYIQKHRPQAVLLLEPAPIAQLKDRSPVAVKGQVAEVFGNKFIVQDDSGRTLVDTGPRGEGGKLVAKGETVTVQGQFDNGSIHAIVMTRADGTTKHSAHRGIRTPSTARGPIVVPIAAPVPTVVLVAPRRRRRGIDPIDQRRFGFL